MHQSLEMVDLYGEELHLVPGVDLGGAAGEEGDDAFDALLEGGEAFLLDLREGAFGDDVADLEVVDAVDENDEAAVVDVAEAVFGVGWVGGRGGTRGRRWGRRHRREGDVRRRARWRGGRRSRR